MMTMEVPWTSSLFSSIYTINKTSYSSSMLRFSISRTLSSFSSRSRPLFMASASRFSPQGMMLVDDERRLWQLGVLTSDANVFQLIQTHQETAVRLPPVEEIRTVLDCNVRGMLSTFSQKYEGYPSGSMVDFACVADGSPILAVSSLAVHTKDLLANPKCSLVVARDPEDRTDLVITLHGDALFVPEKDIATIRAAYLAKHPNAFWVDFGDFQFLRIEPKVVAVCVRRCNCSIGVWRCTLTQSEFSKEEYQASKVDPIAQFSKPVASHMNRDHAEDTRLIVQHSTSIPVDSAYMLDLDSLGFYVKAGYGGNTFKLRIPFPRHAEDRKDVKTLIVEMLQAAKSQAK
ncbi:hypothetical protein Patl1_22931 [Pistacia atlantica]|uniref:Uncharacterized protein n=1 Tax=Pistacia atlantica TaxID=434234 RepID=A0ACC0ZY20_9ROSI|nr:hypothetical protein Patl1_22931 [Pistacia atlantica]